MATAKTEPRTRLIRGFHQRRVRGNVVDEAPPRACTVDTSAWVASASLTRCTLLGM